MSPCIPDRIGIWQGWFLWRGENRRTRRKTSRRKERTNHKLDPHVKPGARIELGGGGAPFKQILRIKELLLHAYWRCRQTTNVVISLCCFAEDGIILKCVPQVQHVYILPFNQSNFKFATSSFLLLSWMLKLFDEEGDSNEDIHSSQFRIFNEQQQWFLYALHAF